MFKYYFSILMFVCLLLNAQTENVTVYEIPFASSDNSIQLNIVNSGKTITENISIKVLSIPDWILLKTEQQHLKSISNEDEKTATFLFDIDISAPVGKEEKIIFQISNGNEMWEKEINIKVQVPKKLELMNNYPNPFNPVTTIGFSLPEKGEVILDIYNILGQKVVRLLNTTKDAGYFKVDWNAVDYASGIYIYKLSFTNDEGKKKIIQKKLMLVK